VVDCQGAGQLSDGAGLLADPQRLVIATRESRLALWQAHHVRDRLVAAYPDCEVVILGMTTTGDQILDRALSEIGGKGLFTKELEMALLDGRADLAVHSLKDVPMVLSPEFDLACVMAREDPRDALVSVRYASIDALPQGARVGTSSVRRAALLRAWRPDLMIEGLRGNLDTRLSKLDRGDYDAIVLAVAGLQRLGYGDRIRQRLPIELSLPAPGQGALGIEILTERDDIRGYLAPLHDARTWLAVTAERAFSRQLDGSCRVALGAHATIDAEDKLCLRALHVPGSQIRRAVVEAPLPDGVCDAVGSRPPPAVLAWAEALGVHAAQSLGVSPG
jgi:hydroxymethylbilane synthase